MKYLYNGAWEDMDYLGQILGDIEDDKKLLKDLADL